MMFSSCLSESVAFTRPRPWTTPRQCVCAAIALTFFISIRPKTSRSFPANSSHPQPLPHKYTSIGTRFLNETHRFSIS